MSLPKNELDDKTNSRTTVRAPGDVAPMSQCATLTGVGRSAIAVIAVTGPQAADAINRCFTPVTRRPCLAGEIRYGTWHGDQPDKQSAGESVVLTRQNDDHFELHCHGGIAATERIIEDLRQAGIQPVDRLTRAGHEPSLLIREAEEFLSRCLTARTAAIALDQVRGALQDWAENWLDRLSFQSEPPALAAGRTRAQLDSERPAASAVGSQDEILEPLHREVRELLKAAKLGTRLADPFRVVLLGPPNVGKSSLINAIVGYDRSITLDLPGTTRDVLHADTVIDGLPIRLSDTAGMRSSSEPIESEGIARAKIAADQADLVVWVTEPGQSVDSQHADMMAGKRLAILNKADLLHGPTTTDPELIRTIATTGDGVFTLMTAIANSLAEGFPEAGMPVPLNDRQANLLERTAQTSSVSELVDILSELLG